MGGRLSQLRSCSGAFNHITSCHSSVPALDDKHWCLKSSKHTYFGQYWMHLNKKSIKIHTSNIKYITFTIYFSPTFDSLTQIERGKFIV